VNAKGETMQLVTEENITDLAVERWSTGDNPRLAHVMCALVRHLHEFAREVGRERCENAASKIARTDPIPRVAQPVEDIRVIPQRAEEWQPGNRAIGRAVPACSDWDMGKARKEFA
jgi:hypothetical protein